MPSAVVDKDEYTLLIRYADADALTSGITSPKCISMIIGEHRFQLRVVLEDSCKDRMLQFAEGVPLAPDLVADTDQCRVSAAALILVTMLSLNDFRIGEAIMKHHLSRPMWFDTSLMHERDIIARAIDDALLSSMECDVDLDASLDAAYTLYFMVPAERAATCVSWECDSAEHQGDPVFAIGEKYHHQVHRDGYYHDVDYCEQCFIVEWFKAQNGEYEERTQPPYLPQEVTVSSTYTSSPDLC